MKALLRLLLNETYRIKIYLLVTRIKNLKFPLLRIIPKLMIKEIEFNSMVKMLTPVDNGFELIRIGSKADGGYLLPDDLIGVTHCFSAGVADKYDFEQEIFDRYNILSTMYDGSILRPIGLSEKFVFHNKFVGASTCQNYISIYDILNLDLKKFNSDLIAQIDIEGGEYELLTAISEKELERFRIIVVEFHNIDRWTKKDYYDKIVKPIFKKMNQTYTLVHSHENNFAGKFKFIGKEIPRTLELTFHNKNRAKYFGGFRLIPHSLDMDNWQ